MKHKLIKISLTVYLVYVIIVISSVILFIYNYNGSDSTVLDLGKGYNLDYNAMDDVCLDDTNRNIVYGPIVKFLNNQKYIIIKEKPRLKIDTLFKIDRINKFDEYFHECKLSPNNCEKQENFYSNFPLVPEDFFNLFEYKRNFIDSSYESNNLYSNLSDYIDLYMNLNCINNEQFIMNSIDFIIVYYNTNVKLNLSVYFEAFEVFKSTFIYKKFLTDLKVSSKILSDKNNDEIVQFWEAILFNWENKTSCLQFKEKLQVIKNFDNKTYSIMESVFQKHLNAIKKGHYEQ